MIGKLLLVVSLVISVATPVMTVSPVFAQDTEADKKTALAAYKKGTIQYNLGNWTRAIEYFKSAFETYPDAAFLFNIAQSYRQASDCKQSSFFYKRYLAIKPQAANKVEVEGFIAELEEECSKQSAPPTTPPTTTPRVTTPPVNKPPVVTPPVTRPVATKVPPPVEKPVARPAPVSEPRPDATKKSTQVAEASVDAQVRTTILDRPEVDPGEAPTLVIAYGSFGSTLFSMGDLDTRPQFNLTLSAGYPLPLGRVLVDAGALLSQTRVNWGSQTASGTAVFTALLANVGASMELLPTITGRAELGVGMMIYSGLDVAGNVFVEEGLMATGAVSSASFRLAIGGEYEITEAIAIHAQPLVLSASPAPAGMRRGIDTVTSYQALVGLGYKM